MEISLRPVEGYNLGNRNKVTLSRYWVVADEITVGFVDFDSPGQVCLLANT